MACWWSMTKHQHTIELSGTDQDCCYRITHLGKHNAHVIVQARILLLSYAGKGKDAIATELGIGRSTVQRTRDKYHSNGLDSTIPPNTLPG